MKSARRDFLRATGMMEMAAFLAACKNSSIARTVIDAGVPESKGMDRYQDLGQVSGKDRPNDAGRPAASS